MSGGGFRHGVHPPDHKETTAGLPIERMPFVERYVMPLSQHAGAPATPVVGPGDRVARGQVIAEPGGFVSTTLHSPVTGRVLARERRPHPRGRLEDALVLEADPFSDQAMPSAEALDPDSLDDETFVRELQRAGLVGMGGAGFPTHVKYAVPDGKRVERLVVNGCECEPWLTSDHRLMLERPIDVVRGAAIAGRRLGADEVVLAVEDNKEDAAAALRAVLPADGRMRVAMLPVKYPQGAEKMLTEALYGIEIPSGKLPLDVGVLVNNVGTMVAIAEWFDRRWPLVERVVTVSGPSAGRPANLLVPIGTPIRDVLRHCDALRPETREIVLGGPMMGMPLADLDAPVLKSTSGILAFTEAETRIPHEYTCIRCGRCVDACPQLLNPSRLARLARAGRWDRLEQSFADDCVECGSCSFACPSGIPIVQLIRIGKSRVRDRRAQRK